MSRILQQPDLLSFAGNLKTFEVSSATPVAFELWKGDILVLNEKYNPVSEMVLINLRTVIDRMLDIALPVAQTTQQTSGFANFSAKVDSTWVYFTVIKGGVAELAETAATFVETHFLSWQTQDKQILQMQPEYLTYFATINCRLKLKLYFVDGTSDIVFMDYTVFYELPIMVTQEMGWAFVKTLSPKDIYAWDVCLLNGNDEQMTPVQRYRLRNNRDEEHVFMWANTLGGIDTVSFTGPAENDRKLEHLTAQLDDESYNEYDITKTPEIKQSTGYLTLRESLWIEDFFYSKKRWTIMPDGSIKPIVLVSSKVITTTTEDLFDYEFIYRLASDTQLLNLDLSYETLPAPEGPGGFFLTELLSSLATAQYGDNLLIAVQNPFLQGWMKISFAQLWASALPNLVDGTSIAIKDGKLSVIQTNTSETGTYGSTKKSAVIKVDEKGAIIEVSEIDIDVGIKNTGERKIGLHAGTLNEISIADDYIYICVAAGEAGTAIWKKATLTQSI